MADGGMEYERGKEVCVSPTEAKGKETEESQDYSPQECGLVTARENRIHTWPMEADRGEGEGYWEGRMKGQEKKKKGLLRAVGSDHGSVSWQYCGKQEEERSCRNETVKHALFGILGGEGGKLKS